MMMLLLLKKAQYLGGWEKHFRFNFHFCRLSEIVENRLFDYFGLSKRREKSASDTTMMMAEKICFMQFYEIDITWQMTSTFDFFFFVSSPPFHFPNNYALSLSEMHREKKNYLDILSSLSSSLSLLLCFERWGKNWALTSFPFEW